MTSGRKERSLAGETLLHNYFVGTCVYIYIYIGAYRCAQVPSCASSTLVFVGWTWALRERERGGRDILMNLSSLVVKSLYRFFFFPSTAIANLTHIQKYRRIIPFLWLKSDPKEFPSNLGNRWNNKEDSRYMIIPLNRNYITYIFFPLIAIKRKRTRDSRLSILIQSRNISKIFLFND